MIYYYLKENPLSKEKRNCIAKVKAIRQVTKADLIKICCDGDCGISPYEVESVFNRLEYVLPKLMKDGCSISTPLININASITGIFDSWSDQFDSKRHNLHFRSTPGTLLRRATKEAHFRKRREVQDIVDIFSFTDHNQNASGNKMIAGSVAELIGKHMKFDSNDSKLGIFFIAADESETRVSVYVKNTDNTQIFQIPSTLQKGEYTMVLRCIPHNFKKIQICEFKKTLIVE